MTPGAILGDEQSRADFGQAGGQGAGRQRRGIQHMDGADPGAGQHGHDGFGKPGEVEGHPITGADTEAEEGRGRRLHLGQELGIGQAAPIARLAFPVQGDPVPAARKVAVETVDCGVEPSANEPSAGDAVRLVHRLEWLLPVQGGGLPTPPVEDGPEVRHRATSVRRPGPRERAGGRSRRRSTLG